MPGYAVKFQNIAIAGGADFNIRSLLDRQQYADPLGEAAAAGISSAEWPLFGLVWPSARVLAASMMEFDIAGKRILEIGCGLALASMVLHRRQADITASDCHPLTENFLRENLRLNQLPAMHYRTGNWHAAASASVSLGRFDLIIGSDVLYDRAQPDVLSTFIDNHANPSAEVMIVDPNRGNRSRFSQLMIARGYQLSQVRADCTQEDGFEYKGRVLSYVRAVGDSLI